MISPVGSGNTSPVYIPQQPELPSDVQNTAGVSSAQRSALKKGIAEFQDSFVEQQKEIRAQEKLQNDRAKAAEAENERNKYDRLTLDTDLMVYNRNKYINHYEKIKFIDAAEKSEQTKGFHRDQPVANAAVEASMNAHITANILSMIRV